MLPARSLWGDYTVFTRPPSMTQFAPVTLAMRGEASRATMVATSLGW